MKRLICLIFIGVFLFGAEYGRIRGRVIDTETGEPLVGADVIIEGTELGAATDESGEFTVLYVPVGTYQVVSSYISYDPFTFTNVVVNADQTTVVNFHLRPTVIEVEGVTVVRERPLVVISQTDTRRAVTSQEMNRLPVTTINQVITLQAGVTESDRGTHVRGGRENEITYFVDGIVTKVAQSAFQTVSMHAAAVEEVTVVSGGFDAEYGDALSGVVNIVTKEGGTKHTGNFRYLTDEVFSGSRALNFGYNLYDIALGGPLPMIPRLRYFLSGELTLTDAYREARHRIPSERIDYRAQARLSYLFPNAKGKVSLSGFNSRLQMVVWTTDPENPPQLKYFDQRPINRIKNTVGSATFNYMLTPKTLMSLKLGVTYYQRFYGNRDYEWEEDNDRKWYQDYRAKGEHLIEYLLDDDLREERGLTIREVLIDSMIPYHDRYLYSGADALRANPYGIEYLFITAGDYRYWLLRQNYDYQARFDITHSIGKVHELKSGVDYTRYDIKEMYNNLPWVTNPFWDYYHRKPDKFAAYIQDKLDFEGIITRLGLRFDYFNPKSFTFEVPNDLMDSTILEAEKSYKFSPRLGFSLPVTDRMKFRFNYGHYFQLAGLDDIYGGTDTSVVRVLITRGNIQLGNMGLQPQKTVQYEVGIENQFSDVLAVGFTAYFKDVYDLSQLREVIALPQSYFQFFNVDYGNIKGFELSATKRMSDMWAFGLSYTLQFARGTASWAGQWYYHHYDYDIDVPEIDFWLDFDERHIVNANLDFEFPNDFFFLPLRDFTSSTVFSYHSGHPHTPMDQRGNRLGDVNSARMDGYWNIDLNFSRRIKLGPVKLQLSGLIYNLFNTDQVIDVYDTTGDPDDYGFPEPALTEFSPLPMSSARYSPQADYNHDGLITRPEFKRADIAALIDYYTDPTNYNGPRRIRVGIGIGF